jgi:predicted RNA-binding protein with RPS1 domain
MTRVPLSSGDVVNVVITKVLPFGALVESGSGVPGLVRGAAGDVGASVRVEVVEVDTTEQRFSARLA